MIWDEDDLDWAAYRICVDWCLEQGIRTVMDLEGRLLVPEAYDVLWLGRCAAMRKGLRRNVQAAPTGGQRNLVAVAGPSTDGGRTARFAV